jgi:hypothetical protein
MPDQTTDLVARLRQASKDRTLPAGISLMEIPKTFPGVLEIEAACEIERLRAVLMSIGVQNNVKLIWKKVEETLNHV